MTRPLPESRLVCEQCRMEYPELTARSRCECGGLFSLQHPVPAVRGEALARRFALRKGENNIVARSGVWRFRELVYPGAGAEVVSHPEGNTPLLGRDRVAQWAGVANLSLKHEGHNPTGSFKDRGMTVGMTQARRLGAGAVLCASTGNTAASLAAYAAHAGIPALVMVPAGQVAVGKLAQSLAYGARTLLVRGDFDTCMQLAREAEAGLGTYLLNSVNPFRIEGQKTIVFELLEQCGWDPPDWIALPAGNLGNTAAFGAALRDAFALGLIGRIPRLAAVQAAGAAPFARAFRSGFTMRERVQPETVATAIRIGDPASWDRGVRAIRETNGVVTDVPDQDILEAKAAVDMSGVGCEAASAASVAGVRRLVREGVIAPGARVVAVLTGHLLKDPGGAATRPQANQPIEIEPRLSEVERAMARPT
jgi:threonine synthase